MPRYCKHCKCSVSTGRHYCSDRCLIKHYTIAVGDCWEWTGVVKGLPPNNYGRTTTQRHGQKISRLAHRVAYEAFVGPIPEGLYLLHKCHNPQCCNPEHLTPGTQLENTAQAIARGARDHKGPVNPSAKLTQADANAIRQSSERTSVLAKQYDVSPRAIYAVRKGEAWVLTS